MEINFADFADTAEIRRLWDIVFPEEPDFNDWFFDNYFKAEYCLVLRDNGVIKAMAQLLPYEIKGLGRVSYIYGAATRPDCRGQGLMSRLLKRSFELDRQRGFAASVLIPQNRDLFDFYSRLGYKTVFYADKIPTAACNTSGYGVREAENDDIPFMNRLYESAQTNFIVRDYEYWKCQLEMFRACGGSVYILMRGSERAAYGFLNDNYLQESFGEGNVLANLVGASSYVNVGGSVPVGMAYSYGGKLQNMYMNMMFN